MSRLKKSCTVFYCSHLWIYYSKVVYSRIHVAYNNRKLCNILLDQMRAECLLKTQFIALRINEFKAWAQKDYEYEKSIFNGVQKDLIHTTFTCLRVAFTCFTLTFMWLAMSPWTLMCSPGRYPIFSRCQDVLSTPVTKHNTDCCKFISLFIGRWIIKTKIHSFKVMKINFKKTRI